MNNRWKARRTAWRDKYKCVRMYSDLSVWIWLAECKDRDNIIIWCDINHFRKVYLTNRTTPNTIYWNKVKKWILDSNRLGIWSSALLWISSQRNITLNLWSLGRMMLTLIILQLSKLGNLLGRDWRIFLLIEKN